MHFRPPKNGENENDHYFIDHVRLVIFAPAISFSRAASDFLRMRDLKVSMEQSRTL